MKTFNELEAELREGAAENPAFESAGEALMEFLRVHGDVQNAGEEYLAKLGHDLHVELLKLHVER